MATRNPTAPARPGERSRSPSQAISVRPFSALEPDAGRQIQHGVDFSPLPAFEQDNAEAAETWPIIRSDRPDTPYVRAPRFLDIAGDLVSAVLIIAGGVFAYGFVPLA